MHNKYYNKNVSFKTVYSVLCSPTGAKTVKKHFERKQTKSR